MQNIVAISGVGIDESANGVVNTISDDRAAAIPIPHTGKQQSSAGDDIDGSHSSSMVDGSNNSSNIVDGNNSSSIFHSSTQLDDLNNSSNNADASSNSSVFVEYAAMSAIDSTDSLMGASIASSLIRKRCSINECEEYCCINITEECLRCDKMNRGMRFCSMHACHESHSNQQGFIEHPELGGSGSKSVLFETSSQSRLVEQPQEAVVESFPMTNMEAKVLRLFGEGFTTSSNSNITVSQKIIGAINHAVYKGSLSVIARKYKLLVHEPAPESLGKEKGRLEYINALISAYSAANK